MQILVFFCLIWMLFSEQVGLMMSQSSFEQIFIVVFSISILKFIIILCLPYFIFWKWFSKYFWNQKIQQIPRTEPCVSMEIRYSILTLFIQSLFLTAWVWGSQLNYFKLYPGFGTQGVASEIVGFFTYFILYDTYFYWSHRFLHQGWFYKNIHIIHHQSLNPTPFASYSFHPIETVITIFYMLPFVFFVPISYEMFFVLLVLTDVGNLVGHLGYEFLPRKVYHSKLGGWLTTPTHHNMHHQFSKSNFGLYWRGWDKYFKTLHVKTESEFYRIKDQKDSVSSPAS